MVGAAPVKDKGVAEVRVARPALAERHAAEERDVRAVLVELLDELAVPGEARGHAADIGGALSEAVRREVRGERVDLAP